MGSSLKLSDTITPLLRPSLRTRVLYFTLIFAGLFPFVLFSLGSVEDFYVKEWFPFLVVPLLIFSNALKRLFHLPAIYWVAISAFIIAVAVSFSNLPVFGQNISGQGETGRGFRIYLAVVSNLLIFLTCFQFASRYVIRYDRWLTLLMYLCILIGVVSFFSYLLNFNVPFLYGNFRYLNDVYSFDKGSTSFFRMGGLGVCGTFGMTALLGLRFKAGFRLKDYVLFTVFLAFLVISGGRATFIGIVAAGFTYMYLSGFKAKVMVRWLVVIIALFVICVDVYY